MWFEIEIYGHSKGDLPNKKQLMDSIKDDHDLCVEVCRHVWADLEDTEYNKYGHTEVISPQAKEILIDAMIKIQALVKK